MTATIPVWNPATEQQFDDVRAFTSAEVSDTVERAISAQRAWVQLPIAGRQRFLFDLASIIDAHKEELARLESQDVGKPLRAARAVESGTLAVNSNSSICVQVPFGGFKQSGIGRELEMEGLRGFTEHKSIFISSAS